MANTAPTFITARLGQATLLSTGTGGVGGNYGAGNARLSDNGRYVVFESLADNLVPGDDNYAHDIFRRDLLTGEVVRVSSNAAGEQGLGNSHNARFDSTGRRVVFESTATNLAGLDTNGKRDIFIKDLPTGEITRVSLTAAGTRTNGDSYNAVFSPDGGRVVFESMASNLTGVDTNVARDIFVKTLADGAVTRVSVSATGAQANGQSSNASFSPDGTKLLFESNASNLAAGDANGSFDLFVKDLVTGAITRVSTTGAGGEADGHSLRGRFADDGGTVIFESTATNLVAGDTNALRDIFAKDLATGEVTRISVTANGAQSDGTSQNAAVAGRWVAFESNAETLAPGDANDRRDIYVKDRGTGAVLRILGPSGIEGDADQWNASLSADGRGVVFETAGALAGADGNAQRDVFMAEIETADVALATDEDAVLPTGRLFFAGDATAHTVSVRALGGAPDALSTSVTAPIGAADGEIAWTFAGGAALQSMAPGDTRQFRYAIAVTEGGHTIEQEVSVTVAGVNDAPVVASDRLVLAAGASIGDLAAAILANDHDVDAGDALTLVAIDSSSTLGIVRFDAETGALAYEASTSDLLAIAAGEVMSDGFGYVVRDRHGAETRGEVDVLVLGANTGPEAMDDAVTLTAPTPVDLTRIVLANDFDPDLGDLPRLATVAAVGDAFGVVALSESGALTYAADAAAFGALRGGETRTVVLDYTIRDRGDVADDARVTITLVGAEDAPIANADALAIDAPGVIQLDAALLANDRDADAGARLRIVSAGPVDTGALALDRQTGALAYTPDAAVLSALGGGETRAVGFDYTVADETGRTAIARATMTLVGANDAPVAVADTLALDAGTAIDLGPLLLANDRDLDAGDALRIVAVVVDGLPGQLVFDAATGAVGYTANSTTERQMVTGERATGTITYTLRDGSGVESTAVATVTVTGRGLESRTGGEGDDRLIGGAANDRLLGLGGDDELSGEGGDDWLDGGAGNDRLNGGAGIDMMSGGDGNDSFIVDDPRDVADGGAGWDIARVRANSYVLGEGMEELVFEGVVGAVGLGNALDNRLTGTAGADRLDGGAGADTAVGGAGDDLYTVDSDADIVVEFAGGGVDTVAASASYALPDHVEILRLTGTARNATGNAGANELHGNSQANRLDGGAGADRMLGGSGGDSYVVDHAGDVVVEASGAGYDTVFTTLSRYVLPTAVEHLTFTGPGTFEGVGNSTANIIAGGGGADRLIGGGGADELIGGGGDDVLEGGTSGDRLRGGLGNDVFVLRRGESSGEQLLDFTGNGAGAGDLIRLEGWGAGSTVTHVAGLDWVVTDGIDGATAAIRITGAVHASDIVFG